MAAKRKKAPQDATLRNVRAASTKIRNHAHRLLILENRMMHAEQRINRLLGRDGLPPPNPDNETPPDATPT